MQNRSVELQPAWVLHSRPYRETSLIVDLLTRDHGKISVVVNGARGAATKKGRPRRGQLLQPFAELLVSWTGKTELKTLKALEQRRVIPLSGIRLFSGLYANELLQRLLQPWQAVDDLLELYIWLLEHLSSDTHLERVLRLFEKNLLDLLGYGLPLGYAAGSGDEMTNDGWYRYDPDNGFWPVVFAGQGHEVEDAGASRNLFSGAMLQALAEDRIEDRYLGQAKRLMRMAVGLHLGERPLRSRELFRMA
ncbi:DNA repair protein RecO [Parendozoicomonas haliclonae]|uniref:DNA repair protein RecO n=1 Tax=Parendozoicomonas haliclonae TaxID=1960125 RepID=A0A1X7ASR8_9GAMM|nr:DNA repair protein RecO [Parendozoicomonas haliclonae]SMA50457.1 DNA repair protein RecO [Parendozoicomonas haliclonae]